MIPGQTVHRSVLRRLKHDRDKRNFEDGKPLNVERTEPDTKGEKYVKYTQPAAKMGDGFPSWEDALAPQNSDIWEM